jgi:hypothetical protein
VDLTSRSVVKELDIVAKPEQSTAKFCPQVRIGLLDNRSSLHAGDDRGDCGDGIVVSGRWGEGGDPVLLCFGLS